MCDTVALELLHTASTPVIYRTMVDLLGAFPRVEMGSAEWARAIEVYGLLAAKGNALHRTVKHPDLLIAAAAELAGITVVHYDKDFDTIAAATDQPTRWVVPRDSL